jgi:hypothetical protein
MAWEKGSLNAATIHGGAGQKVSVILGNHRLEASIPASGALELTAAQFPAGEAR